MKLPTEALSWQELLCIDARKVIFNTISTSSLQRMQSCISTSSLQRMQSCIAKSQWIWFHRRDHRRLGLWHSQPPPPLAKPMIATLLCEALMALNIYWVFATFCCHPPSSTQISCMQLQSTILSTIACNLKKRPTYVPQQLGKPIFALKK